MGGQGAAHHSEYGRIVANVVRRAMLLHPTTAADHSSPTRSVAGDARSGFGDEPTPLTRPVIVVHGLPPTTGQFSKPSFVLYKSPY
jgi:hypothetical protein